DGLRGGGAGERGLRATDHGLPRPAPMRRAVSGPRDHAPRGGDRDRGGAGLSRRRGAAAHADVGQHAGGLDHGPRARGAARRPSSDWSPARGALGPLSPVRHELGGSPSARLVGRSAASTLPSAPASPSCSSSSRGSRCALPRPLAEATAALITESLRFILEDSLAGYALGHGRPPSRDVTRSSPVIPSPPAQASGAVP